jgi:undecaprenyl-phosphate 4-deoxy-4-formamido-L-arabinose transferase
LSLVIPVYNSSASIGAVVDRIHQVFTAVPFEVVLVNDGSADDSEKACTLIAEQFPETVSFVQLSRNFGEHNAVLAGLNHTSGRYVAVLDDDGQNPPEEVVRMYHEIRRGNYDVVYGRYRTKRHGWLRNLGSWFANAMANIMLKKPRDLYLSSFKVMNRFAVNQVIKYQGPFPYVDGLIYRTTRNIGQIDVEHRERLHGRSNYTLRKLVRVWLNMFLNFSILPLRLATLGGVLASVTSLAALAAIWIDKLAHQSNPQPGIRTVLCCIVFFGGLNLLIVGLLGEYLGRLYLSHTGTPQFVVRYIRRRATRGAKRLRRPRDLTETDPEIACAGTTPNGPVVGQIVVPDSVDKCPEPGNATSPPGPKAKGQVPANSLARTGDN